MTFELRHSIFSKKGKRKVQGVQQSQAAALPRHQEEEETDKTKQAQIKQTFKALLQPPWIPMPLLITTSKTESKMGSC